MTEKLGAQAKAILQVFLAFALQLSVVIGAGGLEAVEALTLGQWIMIILATASAYGLTYAIPNKGQTPGELGGPIGFSPKG